MFSLMPIHRLLPKKALKVFIRGLAKGTNLYLSKVERKRLHQYITMVDADLLKWSVNAATKWRNDALPANFVHLHGTRDRIFPLRRIKNARIMQGGDHFMVVNDAENVANELRKIIAAA